MVGLRSQREFGRTQYLSWHYNGRDFQPQKNYLEKLPAKLYREPIDFMEQNHKFGTYAIDEEIMIQLRDLYNKESEWHSRSYV